MFGLAGVRASIVRSKVMLSMSLSKRRLNVGMLQMGRLFCTKRVNNIRNLAIIAHVDHGKTTMLDEMLKHSGKVVSETRLMDSNDLEKERGITIMSKYTSMMWKDVKLNVVDTPGHGDFGGEVERVLSMVEGAILLVDAAEGVMAQTKFVLSKAISAGLRIIVVLNKLDRVADEDRVHQTENEIFDLMAMLDASEEQMGYVTLYASARDAWCSLDKTVRNNGLNALFDTILQAVPAPLADDGPFRMLVTTMESEPFVGRILNGRVISGRAELSMPLVSVNQKGEVVERSKVFKILGKQGLDRITVNEVSAGDIVGIAGFANTTVTDTLCDPDYLKPIPSIPLDPPVISMHFQVNSSPLAGRDGTQCTFPAIKRRLEKEIENNVSLSLKKGEGESMEVFGRGELQLGILIENMRREGFEFSVSPPKIVLKTEGEEKLEPLEEVTIDVDNEYAGSVIQQLSARKGELIEMKEIQGKTRLMFEVPSRSLLGYRAELMTDSRGTAVYNHLFKRYVPYKGALTGFKKGALISMANGTATSFALAGLEARGTLFIGPGTDVYIGMVIGESTRSENLHVNPVKTKHMSNVRTTAKDEQIRLTPPKLMSLEETIAYIRPDEQMEVTPKNIRLKKAAGK